MYLSCINTYALSSDDVLNHSAMYTRRKKAPSTMKTRNPMPEGFSTAPIIRDAMRQSQITQAEIARRTSRNPNTVKVMRRRRSIQARILHEFSLAMGVDLFRPLSDNLPDGIRAEPEKERFAQLEAEKEQLQDEIEELKRQLADQRETNAYLKKALDVAASR